MVKPSESEASSISTQVSLPITTEHGRRRQMSPTFGVKDPICEADISRKLSFKLAMRNGNSIKGNITGFPFRLSLSNTPIDSLPIPSVTIPANTPFFENSSILVLAESCKYLSYIVRTMKSHTLHGTHVFDSSVALHALGSNFDRAIRFPPRASPILRRG